MNTIDAALRDDLRRRLAGSLRSSNVSAFRIALKDAMRDRDSIDALLAEVRGLECSGCGRLSAPMFESLMDGLSELSNGKAFDEHIASIAADLLHRSRKIPNDDISKQLSQRLMAWDRQAFSGVEFQGLTPATLFDAIRRAATSVPGINRGCRSLVLKELLRRQNLSKLDIVTFFEDVTMKQDPTSTRLLVR